ncbi:ABC transporter ATP-binding protein, partial [Burkholderia cenocepacia]
CDEATSALDVSVQAQVLALLAEIQRDTGITYIVISHNLGVVQEISDRVMVMQAGRIVEQGATADVLTSPTDDYTRRLRRAALDPAAMPGIKPRHVVRTLANGASA